MDPRIDTEFAGHRIESVIGRGGASVVYLAEHLRLGRKVALKVLASHLADDEAFRERFIRESRIAAGLDHPNVVTVYDAGEIEGNLYISMRYVEGSDLGRLLGSEGALDPLRTVSILSQIASALDAAHSQGLVHRDVKPANMLVEAASDEPDFDRAYLSDFGISKRTTSREGLTRTGQFVGTVDYVAPEQITGEAVDGKTDVYSLGCVLFECLSGHVPFPGESGVATIYSHLHDAPPSLEGFGERQAGLNRVVARALAKTRGERFDTCGAVIEAARIELATPVSAATIVGPPAVDEPVDVRSDRRDGHARRRVVAVVAGGIAVFVAVVVGALALTGNRPEPGPNGSPGASGSTTSAPTGVPGPPDLYWNDSYPSPDLGGPGKQGILDAVALGDVVVAVGHRPPGARNTGDDDAAAWRSANGQLWELVDSSSFGGDGLQRMTSVAELGDVVVAAGWDDTEAAVWVSEDAGETWTPSISPDLGGRGPQRIRDLAPIGSQLMAIGSSGVGDKADAAAWVSSDGLTWERMDPTTLEAPGQQQMSAVQTLESGLVAIGFTRELGTTDAAVWTYEGDAWTPVEPASLEDPGEEVMLDVAGGGDMPLVAVGCRDSRNRCDAGAAPDADAAVWISSDGRVWDRVTSEEGKLEAAGRQVMRTVVSVGGAFVAAGTRVALVDNDAGVWVSLDGRSWQTTSPVESAAAALGGRGDQSLRALIVYDRRGIALLGFGVTNEGDDENAHVWTAIPLVA